MSEAGPFQAPMADGRPPASQAGVLLEGVLGGLVGGVLGVIPLLSMLDACCVYVVVGAFVGVGIWMARHPGAEMSSGEAAQLGAIAGATKAVIFTGFSMAMKAAYGHAIAEQIPDLSAFGFDANVVTMATEAAINPMFDLAIAPVLMVLFAGLAALSGMLALSLMYSDRSA